MHWQLRCAIKESHIPIYNRKTKGMKRHHSTLNAIAAAERIELLLCIYNVPCLSRSTDWLNSYRLRCIFTQNWSSLIAKNVISDQILEQQTRNNAPGLSIPFCPFPNFVHSLMQLLVPLHHVPVFLLCIDDVQTCINYLGCLHPCWLGLCSVHRLWKEQILHQTVCAVCENVRACLFHFFSQYSTMKSATFHAGTFSHSLLGAPLSCLPTTTINPLQACCPRMPLGIYLFI